MAKPAMSVGVHAFTLTLGFAIVPGAYPLTSQSSHASPELHGPSPGPTPPSPHAPMCCTGIGMYPTGPHPTVVVPLHVQACVPKQLPWNSGWHVPVAAQPSLTGK